MQINRRARLKLTQLLAIATGLILVMPRLSSADVPDLRPLLPAQATLGGWALEKLRPRALTRGDLVVGGVNAGRGVLLRVPPARPTAAATVLVAPGAPMTHFGAAGPEWGQDL